MSKKAEPVVIIPKAKPDPKTFLRGKSRDAHDEIAERARLHRERKAKAAVTRAAAKGEPNGQTSG